MCGSGLRMRVFCCGRRLARLRFEGEGDALFDANGGRLWAAHGVRTCKISHRHVADAWHTPVTSLHLVDPRFYHLDLCFAPLERGVSPLFSGGFRCGFAGEDRSGVSSG